MKSNKILREIKKKLIEINDTKLGQELKEVEYKKSNASKYYETARIM